MPTAKRHFVGVSQTGELLDDPAAIALDEEMISNKYGMASPDTPAIPYLERATWDAPLRRVSWRWVMLSVRISRDTAWLGTKSKAIWEAAYNSVRTRGGSGWMADKKMGYYALLGSVVFAFACLTCNNAAG